MESVRAFNTNLYLRRQARQANTAEVTAFIVATSHSSCLLDCCFKLRCATFALSTVLLPACLSARPVLTGKSCAVGKQFVPFILLRRRRRGGGVEFASCIRTLSAHTPHARAIGSE